MDDSRLYILNNFEEEIRFHLENYRLQITSFSIEDLIDISLGNFGGCLDFNDLERARHQITLTSYYLFHYAYSQENKPTKADNEKIHYHTGSLIKKVIEFKELLWEKEKLPNDKEIQILHSLLDKMILNPYGYMKQPEDIPGYIFKKGYIEDMIIKTLSYRLDHRKCVRTVKRALLQIDELLKKY